MQSLAHRFYTDLRPNTVFQMIDCIRIHEGIFLDGRANICGTTGSQTEHGTVDSESNSIKLDHWTA